VQILVLGGTIVNLTKDPLTSKPALSIRGMWDERDNSAEVQETDITVKLIDTEKNVRSYGFKVSVIRSETIYTEMKIKEVRDKNAVPAGISSILGLLR